MLTNTYPQYDGSPDASAWRYGVFTAVTGASGVYSGHAGTTAGTWGVDTIPLNLQPGTYYLTESALSGTYVTDADCDEARLAIFEDNAGTLTPITFLDGTNYVDMTAEKTDAGPIGPTTIASKGFVIEAGKSYQLAWGLHKAGTTNLRPGVRRMNDGQGPQGLTCYTTPAIADFPIAHTGTANSSGEIPRGYIKFTTAVRKLFVTDYSAAKDVLIPARTDGPWCAKFRSLVVADGQAFTCGTYTDNVGNDLARCSFVHDFGATDQLTFNDVTPTATNVALTGQAGNTFDLLYEHNHTDNDANLFILNKTTGQGPLGEGDFTTICHNTKVTGSRGGIYDCGTTIPQYLKLSGTAAVAGIEVGWEPIVMFGDSQCNKTGESNMSTSATNRLAHYVPLAFTHPRIYWLAGISGSHITSDVALSNTAAYLRYKSPTPGVADLCEMVTPLFCIAGIGVNDIAGIGTTEANRNKMVALMATRIAEILDDIQDRGLQTLIIGVPPYSDGNASEQEAQAILQWNACLEGLALGVRAAYYNPWHSIVQGGTASNAIPIMAADHTGDSGLHYSAAGASVVASGAARALETGIVGGMWNSPGRRLNRERGYLLP